MRQIKAYRNPEVDQFIIYTHRSTPIERYPHCFAYLKRYADENTCKEVKDGKHPWWCLHRPRDPRIFQSPKLIGLTTTKRIELVYDSSGSVFVTDAMYVFRTASGLDPLELMAILQSRAFLFLYRVANQGESRVIPQVKASKLQELPIPKQARGASVASPLVGLAQECIDLNGRLMKAKTKHEIEVIQRQIDALARRIDQLVYELYGLTEEEIRIVEETTA